MGIFHRIKDFFEREDRERADAQEEFSRMEDEEKALLNEARFQEEPAFAADLARKREELERETRALFYEANEPSRSMLQGRCQQLLEQIERPDAVQARLGEVRTRLGELREQFQETPPTGETVGQAAAVAGE